MFKKALLLILFCFNILNANNEKYSISAFISNDLTKALNCKKNILINTKFTNIFIIKFNNKFYTYVNLYNKKELAFKDIKILTTSLNQLSPFVVQINNQAIKNINNDSIFNNFDLNKQDIQNQSLIPLISFIPTNIELLDQYDYDLYTKNNALQNEVTKEVKEVKEVKEAENKVSSENSNEEIKITAKKNEDEKIEEELIKISMDEFDNSEAYNEKIDNYDFLSPEEKNTIDLYDKIIINVDSETNSMDVRAIINGEIAYEKTYKVSTGKKNIKKPSGVGSISAISFNPTWYPTENTIKRFEKKGIVLPKVIPPGHKYNFMGAAKLNLTHSVNGSTSYRIHGTLNENSIGKNESAGCIRMKNKDVLELARILQYFSSVNSLSNIEVILDN